VGARCTRLSTGDTPLPRGIIVRLADSPLAVLSFAELAAREQGTRIARRQWFWLHLAVYVPIQMILFIDWIATDADFSWFAFPLLGWGMILAVHGVYAFVMRTPEEIMIERERREVSTSTGRA
jgi:hypothetical protein